MKNLEMKGPYPLNSDTIDEIVTQSISGNYALGNVENSKFRPRYVGRADVNLNERLKQHVGGDYPRFKFSYASSRQEAFEKECRNYHDFGGDEGRLDNDIHPDRPDGLNLKCPLCNTFD